MTPQGVREHMAVTRADVAKRAGVSPAVVSYVLNPGSRPVSAAARTRVEDAISELGYRPNAIAQALRRSSTMSIGMLVTDLANPVVAALVHDIEDAVYEAGYVVFVGTVGSDPAREARYLRSYIDRQVDAIIMLGANDIAQVAEAVATDIPIIVLDRIPAGLGASSITADSYESSRTAVRHLIEVHGHRRIGCIAGPWRRSGVAEDRVRAWHDEMTAAGLEAPDELLIRAIAFSRECGDLAARQLLDLAEPPTAMFVSSEVQAVGVVGAIRTRDLLVPRDVAVVSYDGSELATRAFPGLTSVDQGISAIAETTVHRMLTALREKEPRETHDVLPSHLVIRRSCGCTD